jgi:superfamily II DNA or RNA helicase
MNGISAVADGTAVELNGNRFVLRPHQQEALDSLFDVWRARDRALVVMPCGSGKTVVAAHAAARSDATFVAVFVPSLALLHQTIRAWRECLGEQLGDVFAVGSHSGLVDAGLTEFAATTDPDMLAIRFAKRGPGLALVVSTYQSAGVVVEAQRRCVVLPVFDVAVFDEAHHLASDRPALTAAVRDLSARRRLFLTATPTAVGDTSGSFIPVAVRQGRVVSMDDVELFGPVAYRLTMRAARETGVLVPWRVVVRTSDAGAFEHGGFADPVVGACEMLRSAAVDMSLRSVLVYVNRVRDAVRFAALLGRTGPLSDGTEVAVDVVTAETSGAQRSRVLDALACRDMLRVVVNVDCLAEGVDVPSLDAVMFANGRSSRVAITQIVGRVARPAPGKETGVVLLPVPVDVTAGGGDDVDAALRTGRFGLVWATCRALRDIDEEFAAALLEAAGRSGLPARAPALPGWVFDVPGCLAEKVAVSCVDAAADLWWRWFGRLKDAVQAGEAVCSLTDMSLRSWCATQRRERARGVLPSVKAAALNEVPGWFWVKGFTLAAGSLKALVDLWPASGFDVCSGVTFPVPGWARHVGVLAAWARVACRRGRLDADVAAALGKLPGWVWSVVDADVAAEVDALDRFRAWEGHVDVPVDHVEHGVALGLAVQRWRLQRAAGTLPDVVADEIVAAAAGKFRWKTGDVRWSAFLDVLRDWCVTHGHARSVGDVVVDTSAGRLHFGHWVNRVRFEHRHGQLAERWVAAVEQVDGWSWEAHAPRAVKVAGLARHGSRGTYVRGCRCEPCTAANNKYRVERAAREPAVRCDAAAAAAHLERLTDAGLSLRHVSALLAVSRTALQKLANGGRGYVSHRTFAVLEAAVVDDLFAQIVERAGSDDAWRGVFVPAGPTLEAVASLHAAGWPKSWIARECGLGAAIQFRSPKVRAGAAARVARLVREVEGVVPPRKSQRRPLPSLAELRAGLP